MRQAVVHIAIVVAVTGLVMFTNLGGPKLWDRDEPRNAGCAWEMLARGDWVTPVFNGELRTHKPVLLYWCMMAAYSVFGVNEFAARFASAAAALGTAVCTYAIGRRLFQPQVGAWAGVIVATTLMFDVAGRAATPDSLLILFSTLAIALYVFGTTSSSQSGNLTEGKWTRLFPRWHYAVALYGVMGIAMLAKGPVGLILPTAVIGMFLLIMRLPAVPDTAAASTWKTTLQRSARVFDPIHFLRTCWFMRPITALAASLAVALPWYLWVGVRTDGEFLRGFFFEHNVGRAMTSMEGHDGSLLFYPVAILIGFFPWSVFTIPIVLDAIHHARENRMWRRGYVLAACWVGVYVGLFSLASTKLPSYVTPCYPALALVTACFIDRWTCNALHVSRNWLRAGLSIHAFVGLVLLMALPIAAQVYLPGEAWLGLIGLVPLCGGVTAWILFERSDSQRAAITLAASAATFTTLLFGGVADRVSQHQENVVLLNAIERSGDSPRVGSFGHLEPTWVFYGGRPVEVLADGEGGSPTSRLAERDGKWLPKTAVTVEQFVARGDDSFIITTADQIDHLRPKLPHDFEVLAETPYFLKQANLVVLGPSRAAATANHHSGTDTSSALR